LGIRGGQALSTFHAILQQSTLAGQDAPNNANEWPPSWRPILRFRKQNLLL
jgi:hypothetical protein